MQQAQRVHSRCGNLGRKRIQALYRNQKAHRDQIPIILVTKSLSDRELRFHQKQKFHADLYLDKKFLTPNSFLGDFRKIVTLGTRTGVPLKSNPQIAAKRVAGDNERFRRSENWPNSPSSSSMRSADSSSERKWRRSPRSKQVFPPSTDSPP